MLLSPAIMRRSSSDSTVRCRCLRRLMPVGRRLRDFERETRGLLPNREEPVTYKSSAQCRWPLCACTHLARTGHARRMELTENPKVLPYILGRLGLLFLGWEPHLAMRSNSEGLRDAYLVGLLRRVRHLQGLLASIHEVSKSNVHVSLSRTGRQTLSYRSDQDFRQLFLRR